jgi:hypothetical protein
MSVRDCQPLLADHYAQVSLSADAVGFTAAMRTQLADTSAGVDHGYPDNADLMIDDEGLPHLKARRGTDRRPTAIADRCPTGIALEQTCLTRQVRRFGGYVLGLAAPDPLDPRLDLDPAI